MIVFCRLATVPHSGAISAGVSLSAALKVINGRRIRAAHCKNALSLKLFIVFLAAFFSLLCVFASIFSEPKRQKQEVIYRKRKKLSSGTYKIRRRTERFGQQTQFLLHISLSSSTHHFNYHIHISYFVFFCCIHSRSFASD